MARRRARGFVTAAGTRKGRTEARKEARARLLRLHVVVAAVALAGLSLPRALATPDRSDEAALLVCVLWAVLWLRPARRAGERAGPGSLPAPSGLRRALRAVLCLALGLGLYWSSLLLPRAGRVRPATRLETQPRPAVIVTSPDNPFFLARVVRVNDDLSLAVDDGTSLGVFGSPGQPSGTGPSETVVLAGVGAFTATSDAAEAAARLMTKEVLGRLVTLWVPETRSGGTVLAPPGPVFVYPGIADVEKAMSGRSLNSEVEALLTRLGPGDAASGGAP